MPRTGVSVLRDELEALNTWVEAPPEGRSRRSEETSEAERAWRSREVRDERARRLSAVADDGPAAVRARSGAAFRERRATSRVEATPRPVRAGAAPPSRAADTGTAGAVGSPSAEARAAAARIAATIFPPAATDPPRPAPRGTAAPAAPARRPPKRPPAPANRPSQRFPATADVQARGDEPSPARRTVTIRGQVADRYSPTSRRRPDVPRHERPGFKPDRVAMWAVLLGLVLVLVAATSAHAALLVR